MAESFHERTVSELRRGVLQVAVLALLQRQRAYGYDILRLLVVHAGKVLTHRMIMNEVWGAPTDAQYLRIYVRQIRQKIEENPERPQHILTETGVGSRLVAD